MDQLLHGAVELPDDVLDGQHHTQSHVAVDYGSSGQYGDEDILHLINRDTPGLLYLLKVQCLQIDLEQIGLHVFPLPALALLAALQLDLLHPVDKLIGHIAIAPGLLKIFIVQCPAFLKEKDDPPGIEECPQKENNEDASVIDS